MLTAIVIGTVMLAIGVVSLTAVAFVGGVALISTSVSMLLERNGYIDVWKSDLANVYGSIK